MRPSTLKSLVLLIVLMVSTFSWSGIIDIPKQSLRYDSGTNIPVQVGNTASVSAPSESATFADITRKGLITLAVDHHYSKIIAENHTSVEFEVTPYSALGSPGTPFTFILEVDYKPNGELEFNDKTIYELDNILAFDILILEILVDGNPADLPENLYIDAEMYIDRIFDFSDWLDESPDVEIVNSTKILDTDCDEVDDALLIRWDPISEAEEYQVEWTYVNDYTDQTGVYLNAEDVAFNFRKNSSRITTNSNEYKIPLTYDHGYVIYRVRAVGRLYTDPVYLQFSEWSLPESGKVDPDGGDDYYWITVPWEQSKNWQYSVSFAEEGKRKEVVSFFDGSLRNRQMVTLVSTNNKAIVGETLYDHQGRPAIQVLPVPVSNPTCGLTSGTNSLKYYENFNRNALDSAYNRKNFDVSPSEACTLTAQAMNTNSGASNYYSSANPEMDGKQSFVPSAGGFPFSQVEYTPDNTGRIRRQGGVGSTFQLGSGHETKYFYGHPSQIELDRLFGSEVGCASHYQKNMVVDPNGQVSVSYLDQEGRVIATSLAGNAPDSLIALESEAVSGITIIDELISENSICTNEETTNGTSQTVNQTVLISATTDVEIFYSQEITMFTEECLAEDICFGCVYDLEIEFKDQCGQSLIPDNVSSVVTGHFEYFETNDSIAFTLDCAESEVENSPLTIVIEDVPVGSYQMSKTLTISDQALSYYEQQYLDPEVNTCIKTLEDFQQEYLENADYSGCEPDTTCQQCLDDLPTWDYFEENELGTLEAYNALVAECDALCEPTSMSDAYRDFLLMDMQPGGQYAEYLLADGTFHPEQFPLSILNASNQLPREDDWRSPVYEKNGTTNNKYFDEDLVTESKVWLEVYFDVNGDIDFTQPPVVDTALVEYDPTEQEYYTIAQNLLNTEDFVNEFKTSWANSLIYYHPEYLMLKTYQQLAEPDDNGNTSEAFDHLMEQTNTWDEAIANGFIKSGYASETVNNRLYDFSTPSLSHAYDPFLDSLADTVRWTNYKNAFLYALNTKYQSISSTNYTMAQVAAFTGRCGDEIGGTTFLGECFGFGFNATGSSSGGFSTADKVARNRDWQNFKSFYRSLKQQYISQISLVRSIEEPDYYGYNGCIGATDFNPYNGGFLAPGFNILQSQYLNNDQPCFFANVDLYANKVKRFMLPSDVGGTGNGIDFALSVDELNNQAQLAGYTYAGDCPLATGILTLCDNMADAGDLLATSYDLPNNPGFVAFVNTYQGITEPVTPLPAMEWDAAVVDDSTLYIEINDLSGLVAEIQFDLFEDSLVDWNDIDGFAGIQATGAGGLGYRFTAHAVAYYPDSTVYYPLEGSTSLDIFHCTVPDHCEANDLGSDIFDLMNAMALTGAAFSTSPVAIKGTGADTIYIPFVTNRIAEILSGTITPASDIYWHYSSGKLRIGKTSAVPSREITLTIDNLFSVYTYFSGIAAFSSMTVTGDNTAVFTAVDDSGVFICNLECSIDFEINRIPADLFIGSCAPPELGCDGTEYQNAADLENLLEDVLVNQNPSYNLYSSQALTNSFIGQFPGVASTSSTTVLDTVYAIEQSLTGLVFDHQTVSTIGTTTTTKTYYTQVTATHELLVMDSVVCEEGETGPECDSLRVTVSSIARTKTIFDKTTIEIGENCSLILNYKHDFINGFDISDVTEVNSFELVGPVNDDGYYHKFKLIVEMGSKTDSIFGEFCLPMLPCNPITSGFNPTAPFPVVVIEDPCYALVTGSALSAAANAYNAYKDSVLLDFTNRYKAHCMSTIESFGRQYDQKEYHFTLYYYDQAGNLVKTIPPEGVEQFDFTTSTDPIAEAIGEDRENGTHTVITNHRMATVYAYNSLNQLVAQHMPDMDDMSSWSQTLPNGLDANLVTTAIQMVDNSIGYLTGYLNSGSSPTGSRGYLYRTLNGGANWTRITSLFMDNLAKVRMIDQNNGFAVGTNGTVLKTVDGGTSWDLMDLHTAGITGSFVDLAVHSSTVAAFLRTDGAIMKLSTSLSTTLYTPAVSGLTLNSIRSIEPLDGSSGVYSVSAEFTASGNTFTELLKIDLTGSGTTTEEESRGATWNTVYYCSSTLGIAGGQDGDIMYLTESGSAGTGTQYHQSSNIVGNILDVAFVNKQNGMAIVDDGGAGNIFCYYTTNAGATWTKVISTAANSMAVMTQSSSIMYVAVSYTDGNVRFYSMNSSGSMSLKWTKLVSANYDKMTFYYNDYHSIIGDRYAIVATSGLNVYVSGLTAVSAVSGPSFNSYFTWASGSAPTDIKAVKVSTTVHVVAIRGNTTVSDLYSIGWNGSTPTATEVVISPASTAFKSLQMVLSGTYVLAYEHNFQKVHRLVLTSSAPSSGSLGAISGSTSLLTSGITVTDMALHSNYVTLVGTEGRAVSSKTSVTSSSTTNLDWQERSTMRLLPIRDISRTNYTATNTYKGLAVGDLGTIFRRNSSTTIWSLIPAAKTNNLKGVSYAMVSSTPYACVYGDATTAFRITLSTNTFTNLGFSTTPTGNFTDISLTAVTSTGYAIISSDNGYTFYTASLTSGSPTLSRSSSPIGYQLNSLCFAPQSSGTPTAISVGNDGRISKLLSNVPTHTYNVFGPMLNSVHFANATMGTVVGQKFFVRSTVNSGSNWTKVFPSTINSANLQKNPLEVWTRPTTATTPEHYAVIGGGDYLATIYNAVATGGSFGNNQTINDIRFDVSEPNIGYIAQYNKLYKMILTVSGASYSYSTSDALSGGTIGTAINAIHVFDGDGTDNAVMMVGYNTIQYKAQGATTTSSMLGGIAGNIRDVVFTDLNHGYVVGDDGLFYQTDVITFNAFGTAYTGMSWLQRGVTDAHTGTTANVDIGCLEFPSATHGIWGGSFTTSPGSAYPNVRVLNIELQQYSSRFYYDRLGRIVASQNSRQKAENKYAYTLYDALGRVTEAGEKTENSSTIYFAGIFGTNVGGQYITSVIDDSKLNYWITTQSNTTRKEVTRSYYDEVNPQIAASPVGSYYSFNEETQRKRIVHVTYEETYDGKDSTYDHATHYDYDIHGNVKTLIQDNKKLGALTSLSGQRFKKMDYVYDLISGNVHRVDFQTRQADQWHHAYVYDADNRITDVYTTTSTPLTNTTYRTTALQLEPTLSPYWDKEAHYDYYDHGPLARTTIGDHEVQGLDYAYTLQGWIKGVNSNVLAPANDPGQDSRSAEHALVARDVMGYSLHYYDGDYSRISTATDDFIADQTGSDLVNNSHDLFNGNIASMVTTITHPDTRDVLALGNAYKYDQLNRLKQALSYTNLDLGANDWGSGQAAIYRNTFVYDANGNILNQNRSDENGDIIDSLVYKYHQLSNGKTIRNRLYHVDDYASSGTYGDDIDDMGTFTNGADINAENNYTYDAEGRLIKDEQEGISEIKWRVDGKVKQITNGIDGKRSLRFDYDAMGHRIAKHVYTYDYDLLLYSDYYTLDAQGNVMSVYRRKIDPVYSTVSYEQREKYIYGSSRLGVLNDSIPLYGSQNATYDQTEWSHTIGKRNYELSNHLGNVLSVISDKVIAHGSGVFTGTPSLEVVDYFMSDILQSSDYSGFGVQLSGRNFTKTGAREARHGFQGQEEDDEIKGEGNSVNYTFRMHDPRLGRFFAIDPLTALYPHYTPYSFSGNKLIHCIELEGLEEYELSTRTDENGKVVSSSFEYNKDARKLRKSHDIHVIHTDYRGVVTRKVMSAKEASKFYKGEAIDPTPVPSHIFGTKHYYRWRSIDFGVRHELMGDDFSAPDYYLEYGDYYIRRFKYNTRPKLSKEGKVWLDKTLVNLQTECEKVLETSPVLELSSVLFQSLMFNAHPDAYTDAGLLELGLGDLTTIANTPDFKDLITAESMLQISTIIGRLGAHYAKKVEKKLSPRNIFAKIPRFIPHPNF